MAKRRRASTAGLRGAARPERVARSTRPRSTPQASRFSFGGPMLLAGVLVVAAVAVVSFALLSGGGPSGGSYTCQELLQPQQGASAANPIVTPNLGINHVTTGAKVDYPVCPPASGPHYNQRGVAPLPPRFYAADAGIVPGNWIHNLEHGFVVALYRCVDGTCPSDDELSDVRSFLLNGPSTPSAGACGYQSKVLAARFDDMATPYALLAWDRVLLLDEFDAAVALDFAQRWIETTAREPTLC